MDDKTIKEIQDLSDLAFRNLARRGLQVDESDREDITGQILLEFVKKPRAFGNLKAYVNKAVSRRAINLGQRRARRETLLKKKSPSLAARGVLGRDETGELEPGEFDAVDESSEPEHGQQKIPGTLIEEAEDAEAAHARREFIRKSVGLVDLLYRLSLARADNPNVSFLFCLYRAINALSVAKTEVDDAILGSRQDFGVYKFRRFRGLAISRFLQDEIDALWSRRTRIVEFKSIFPLPDFVVDAIPKLRADPVMLILRVFYKKFKIRSGRYSTRAEIKKIILELKDSETGKTDIFASVSDKTNFETLRKKIYRKSADPFYDKVADWICEVCNSAVSPK